MHESDRALLNLILRERWRASRLPSVPSALRDLDPRQPLSRTGAYRSAGCDTPDVPLRGSRHRSLVVGFRMRKMNAGSLADLMTMALRLGLLPASKH